MQAGFAERLAQVPWAELQHAYGSADDAPEHLLALLSDDEQTRGHAMYELWASICHQGSVYEASCAAVPFLLEIVAAVPDERKPDVLYLLAGLAHRDSYANRDRTILLVERDYQHMTANDDHYQPWSYGQFLRDGNHYHDPRWMALAHERVGAGIPLMLDLLSSGGDQTQQAALYALSAFKEHSRDIVPAMEAVLATSSSPFVRACALLGLSEVRDADSPAWEQFTDLIRTESHPLLRFVSALALAKHHVEAVSPASVGILVDAMVTPRELDELYRRLPWRDESVHVEAAAALGQLGVPTGLNALGAALEQGAPHWRVVDTVRVAEVILDVAFFGDWVEGRYWSHQRDEEPPIEPDTEEMERGDANPYVEDSYYNYGTHGAGGSDPEITCSGYDTKETERLKHLFAQEGKAALNSAQRQALQAVLRCEPLWQKTHQFLEIYGLPTAREELARLVDD